jgi:hypothetical protein
MASSLELFAPTAARIRRCNTIAKIASVLFFLSFALLIILVRSSEPYIFPFVAAVLAIAVACLVVIGVASFACPALRCPICQSLFGRATGFYCPMCGARNLSNKEGTIFEFRHCIGCERNLFRGRFGNNYKTRYCTHCGEHMDVHGL